MRQSKHTRKSKERALSRELLRSSFASVFWSAFKAKQKRSGYRLLDLAKDTANDKATVSRWFSSLPNWQIDTIADIADALDVDLIIEARERSSATVHSTRGGSRVEPAPSPDFYQESFSVVITVENKLPRTPRPVPNVQTIELSEVA